MERLHLGLSFWENPGGAGRLTSCSKICQHLPEIVFRDWGKGEPKVKRICVVGSGRSGGFQLSYWKGCNLETSVTCDGFTEGTDIETRSSRVL